MRWLILVALVGCHDEDAWRRIQPDHVSPRDAPPPIDASPRDAVIDGPAPIDASPRDAVIDGPAPAERPDDSRPKPPPPPPPSCFVSGATYAMEESLSALVVADFDGDGKVDVLATMWDTPGGRIGVFRGAGDGTIEAPKAWTPTESRFVYAVSTADLDGDGILDVSIANPDEKRIELFRGAGDGTFGAKPPLVTARKPYSASLSDIDGDRRVDLVVDTFTHVEVYRGTGPFTFKRKAIVKTGQAPDGPLITDLDGDKLNDLAYVSNDESFFFSVLNQKGRFTANQLTTTCGSPAFLADADLDGDGDRDAAYTCADGMELQLNEGKGTFRMVKVPFGGAAHESIVSADFTGDGHPDILAPHGESGALLALATGDGTGAFAVRENIGFPGTGGEVTELAMGDLDGDGHMDAVVGLGNGRPDEVVILLGRDCHR